MFRLSSVSLASLFLTLLWIEGSVADDCGGVVNGTQGEITSPVRPDANISCVWYFVKTQDKYVIYNLEELELDGAAASLLIYSGNSTSDVKEAELVSNFTQGLDHRRVLISSNVTTVVLFTGQWAELNKTANFRLRYEVKPDCAERETVWSSKINTPLFDKDALPLECSYNFTVENPAQNLTLSFSEFTMAGGQVTLMSNNKTLASLSGTSIPEDFFFKGDNLQIEFNANSSKTNEFAAVLISVDPDCLQNLTLEDWGLPVPLVLPRTSTSPVTCQWVITSPANGTVRVSLDDNTISSVRALVSDGRSLFGATRKAYLGLPDSGISFVSSGETVSLFVSIDSALRNEDIRITATPQKYGGFFKDNGTLEGHGVNSDGSSSWYYYLNVADNEKVRFELTDSSLYPATTITCYDGVTETSPVLAVFRSDLPFYPVVSSEAQMVVVASNLEFRGFFTAEFSGQIQVCDAISEGVQGHYEGQVKHDGSEVKGCSWVIQPNKEAGMYLVRASLTGFQPLDNVALYDGLSEYNSNIILVRGGNSSDTTVDLPVIAIPASNGARLLYYLGVPNDTNSTSDMSTRTVKADYTFTSDQLCGGNLPTNSTGNIYSPFYPNERYPLNLQCTWNTSVQDGKLFYISFDDFQLDSKHSVKVIQYVNNTDADYNNDAKESNSDSATQFNGSVTPSDLILHGPKVNITFTTEKVHQGGNSGRGFNISYRTIDSGGILSGDKGTFSTPHFPTSVSSSVECIWIINLPAKKDNSSSVQIVQFDLDLETFSKMSRNNTLEFRDGNSQKSPLSTFKLTNGKVSGLYSRTNQLWIRYMYKLHNSASNAPGFAFKLSYSTYVCPVSQQCKNGICMQPGWKCNGIDECGDNSDEKDCSNTITTTTGVVGFVVAILFIVAFILGILVTLVGPAIYKRIRYPNYSHLRDIVSPIDT